MTETAQKFYTVEEYLALEEKAVHKSEYYNGRIFQMTGGSRRHNQICINIAAMLNFGLLDEPCTTYSSDMRILIEEHDLFTYPDCSVVCGEVEPVQGREDIITNPILLVEVLSKSTQNYDRSAKFEFYQAIPALQYYIIIDQERPFVEFYRKLPDNTWQLETLTGLEETVRLSNLANLSLPLARIYSKVVFPTRVPRRLRTRYLRPRQDDIPHPDPTE